MTSANKITAISSLGTLVCCLCCCAVPGAIALGVLNSVFGEWPSVRGEVVDKIQCNDDDYEQGDEIFYFTYNYVTLDGQNVTATTSYCTSVTSSTVYYNPEIPENIVDGTSLLIGTTVSRVLTGVGWTFVIVSLALSVCLCTRPNNASTPSNNFQRSSQPQPAAAVVATPMGVSNEPVSFAKPVEVPTGSADATGGSSYGASFATATPLASSTGGPISVYK